MGLIGQGQIIAMLVSDWSAFYGVNIIIIIIACLARDVAPNSSNFGAPELHSLLGTAETCQFWWCECPSRVGVLY